MEQENSKHKEETDRSGKKFKRTRREQEEKNGGKKKKNFSILFNISGGSHTRGFSISWEHPRATTLM
jgi:ribosomal protein S6E (S10)